MVERTGVGVGEMPGVMVGDGLGVGVAVGVLVGVGVGVGVWVAVAVQVAVGDGVWVGGGVKVGVGITVLVAVGVGVAVAIRVSQKSFWAEVVLQPLSAMAIQVGESTWPSALRAPTGAYPGWLFSRW
jgi:hypothetical protein